ncbi:cytochrome c oxidase subunit I [Picrophilus oshimae]|uniref:Cytochrome c oxidase subunit I+III n=1 Tax=Picrophilus torridus (strain ATCC 700027 / DSM 9790 / JCM 10055 / NBRC 100828 / KAW 2/3) TaxID=1122961 RepID=A0A8G2FWZ3_PICTO|nr:cbb3-type cytochrome c oxidase subunit I [Picrophilus oshimae]SMD31040.1 cytochrome c oxidase subunit I+III [Picrophilus oshimae DSM 9789]
MSMETSENPNGKYEEYNRIYNSVKGWIFTTNHKQIGLLYILTSLFFFIGGGVMALLMRVQLAIPRYDLVKYSIFSGRFLDALQYNQLVTIHGLTMLIWFLGPLGTGFGIYLIPLAIGSRDMIYPRMNALGYWLFLFSGIMLWSGFFLPGGNLDTGWTVYEPLSSFKFTPYLGADTAAAAVVLRGIGTIIASTEILATIFKARAKGYRMMNLPLFVWAVFWVAAISWFVFPEITGLFFLLLVGNLMHASYYISNYGGALMWENLFWYFGHPEVYLLLLPGTGAMFDYLSNLNHRPPYLKKWMIAAMGAISVDSVMVFLHHTFMTGIVFAWLMADSIFTETISIPTSMLIVGLIATMIGGRHKFQTPILFALAASTSFMIGGVSGVTQSSLAIDTIVHGDYYVVAHFHYFMVGVAVMGLMGNLYYYFPKFTGRMYSEKLGRIHWAFAYPGVNILYFPMFFLYDLPRRVYTYQSGFGYTIFNEIATAGAFIFGLSFLIMFANFAWSLKYGEKLKDDNPYRASAGFVWFTSNPPKYYNFDYEPYVGGSDMRDLLLDKNKPTKIEKPLLSSRPLLLTIGSFIGIFGAVVALMGYPPYAFGTLYRYLGFVIIAVGIAVFAWGGVGWLYDDYKIKVPTISPTFKDEPVMKGLNNMRLGMLMFLAGNMIFIATMFGVVEWLKLQSVSPYVSGGYSPDPVTWFFPSTSTIYLIISIIAIGLAALFAWMSLRGAISKSRTKSGTNMVISIILSIIFIITTILSLLYLGPYTSVNFSSVHNNPVSAMYYIITFIQIAFMIGIVAVLVKYALQVTKRDRVLWGRTATGIDIAMWFLAMIFLTAVFTGIGYIFV